MAADEDGMTVIESELVSVREKVPAMESVDLVTCVPALVRVHIKLTEQKQLSMCMQFPDRYPHSILLIELKSKTLGDKLLDGLGKVCDEETKNYIGQKQVVIMVKFLKKFLEDNPLCVCSEEISLIKKEMLEDCDDLKLKQKTSQIVLKLRKNKYYMTVRVTVPDVYPHKQVETEVADSNFPELLKVNFKFQCIEIARRCVQPPLKKNSKDPPFKPQPSLKPVCDFLIRDSIKRYPDEVCPLCRVRCLPEEPQSAPPGKSKEVIKVYCGHIFHFGCMDEYMKTPPFTGGKKCPSCECRIYHDQWQLTPELAETRWAHKEARRRELDEVVDFLE